MRLEGLGHVKNRMTSLVIEPATFRLVTLLLPLLQFAWTYLKQSNNILVFFHFTCCLFEDRFEIYRFRTSSYCVFFEKFSPLALYLYILCNLSQFCRSSQLCLYFAVSSLFFRYVTNYFQY
jgi:hypothetical protein